MLILAMLSVLSAVISGAAESRAARSMWKIHLELPVVSGFNRVFRDEPQPWARAERSPSLQLSLIGLCVGRHWVRGWAGEGCARVVIPDLGGLETRNELGVRGGRPWTVGDRRTESGVGWVALLLPLGGVAYRGRGNDHVQGPHQAGQFSFAVTATLALDWTYFTSARFGWTLRARADGALVFHQAGPPIWESDEQTIADGYRGRVGGGLDLGVTF